MIPTFKNPVSINGLRAIRAATLTRRYLLQRAAAMTRRIMADQKKGGAKWG